MRRKQPCRCAPACRPPLSPAALALGCALRTFTRSRGDTSMVDTTDATPAASRRSSSRTSLICPSLMCTRMARWVSWRTRRCGWITCSLLWRCANRFQRALPSRAVRSGAARLCGDSQPRKPRRGNHIMHMETTRCPTTLFFSFCGLLRDRVWGTRERRREEKKGRRKCCVFGECFLKQVLNVSQFFPLYQRFVFVIFVWKGFCLGVLRDINTTYKAKKQKKHPPPLSYACYFS